MSTLHAFMMNLVGMAVGGGGTVLFMAAGVNPYLSFMYAMLMVIALMAAWLAVVYMNMRNEWRNELGGVPKQ